MTASKPIHDPADHAAAEALGRIPLSLRMIVYSIAFLGLVLVALPAAFYQLDRLFPAIHYDIGAFRIGGVVWFVLSLLAYLGASIVLTTLGKGPFVEFDPPKELVIDGPYRYVRNPVVCTLLSAMFGIAWAMSSTGILLMCLIFVVLAHVQVVRFEEPLLQQRYGQAYVDYCARVPRWIPRRPMTVPPPSPSEHE